MNRTAVQPDTLYFLPSPLYGWGLSELADKLAPSVPIVWCELEPELRALSQKALASLPIAHRLVEWVPGSSDGLPALDWSLVRRVATLSLTGGRSLHPDKYQQLQDLLSLSLENFWKNKMTLAVMGPLWSRNLWRNLASIQQRPALTADYYKRLWKGKKLVVAGAGPGLEEVLPSLRSHRQQLTIISADTALPVLTENGIVPDMVAALEGQIHNLSDFIGNINSSLPLALDLSSHPSTIQVTKGPLLWTMTPWTPLTLWDRILSAGFPVLVLPPLGSVGNYAAELALHLTDGTVFHAGLDFSFPAGKTHARGSPHHRRLLARHHRLQPAAGQAYGYHSGPHQKPGWRTTPALRGYAAQLLQQGQGRLVPWSRTFEPLQEFSSLKEDQHPKSAFWNFTEFLNQERMLVQKVLDGLAQANRSSFPEDWDDLMAKADHLWAWFPDSGLPHRGSSFLSRVLAEASGWMQRFTRLSSGSKHLEGP